MNFDESCAALRPDLHRFCARMTGNPCDGEDLVQDTLAVALARRDELRAPDALRSWLFRIAHSRCIDFLRARRTTTELEDEGEEETMGDDLDEKRRVEQALANLVTELPAKERAAVMLKDVLDCTLEETAEITATNVNAVKAALHRGREKLRSADASPRREAMAPATRAVIERYLAAFNRRDWEAVRALVATDAELVVVDRRRAPFAESPYLSNYEKLPEAWRLEIAWVDGIESVVHFRNIDGAWRPHSLVALAVEDGRISQIRDYIHVDYLVRSCEVATVSVRAPIDTAAAPIAAMAPPTNEALGP